MRINMNDRDIEMVKALLSDHACLCRDEDEQRQARDLLRSIEEQEESIDPRLPESYCEIEYEDMESEEAVIGSHFDDMNFLRYFER